MLLPNNGFFDFQMKDGAIVADVTGNSLDISKILDLGSVMRSVISGYSGTDSMPPCTNRVCWYLYEKVFKIEQAQLNFFKADGLDSNARDADTAKPGRYRYTFVNEGYFPSKVAP